MPAKYNRVHSAHGDSSRQPTIRIAPRELKAEDSVELRPFECWRTRKPQDLDGKHVGRLRAELLRTRPVNDSDWLQAVTGDAAAAIGVAIRALKVLGMTDPLIDIVMSAVLACALEDDPASRVMISSALRRRKKIDPRCQELWLLWRTEPL
jgi:hypothetical protein